MIAAKSQSKNELDLHVTMDAVKVSATGFRKQAFRELEGYRCAYDYRLPGSGKDKAYERVCGYVHEKTGLKIGVAYDRANGWMPACMVTISPPDRTGMRRARLEEILDLCPNFRFLKLELAHDFNATSIVDAAFVRKHLVVGKSHRTEDSTRDDILYFGARRSPVFARCYFKREINCYRVELEFHREWLKKNHIATTDDFKKLPDLLRTHIAFYKFDPLRLAAALERMGVPVAPILKKAISRQDDLSILLRYLRSHVGLTNSTRILVPLKTNSRVEKALRLWVRNWEQQAMQEVA